MTAILDDNSSKIWHGEMDSIGSVILKSMLENPQHISQICYESRKELTNGDIVKLSIQAAKHFQKLNLQPGDLIAMCVENSNNAATLFFGALLAGLCVYGLDPIFNKEGIQRICALAKPKLMICDGDIYHKVREALEESHLYSTPIYTERLHHDGVQSAEEFFEETTSSTIDDFKVPTLEKGSDQVAAIVCLSDSTEPLKGESIAAILHSFAVSDIPIDPNQKETDNRTVCIRALYSINGFLMLLQGTRDKGEMCVRTKSPGAGNFNDTEATRMVYDESRWYQSNVSPFFKDDGQLFMVERKTDILKYGAFYFAPSNIEKVIKDLPEILDVCVVGFPDSTYGYLPAAAVVKQPGRLIKKSQIIELVADRMQHFEQLHGGIYFFDSLPRNLSGEIRRREVAELCKASGQFEFSKNSNHT